MVSDRHGRRTFRPRQSATLLSHCLPREPTVSPSRVRDVKTKKAARTLSPSGFTIVGMTGFEPATLCSQNRCATKLRHIPRRRQSNHRQGPGCTSIRLAGTNGMQLTDAGRSRVGQCDPAHLRSIWRPARKSTIVVNATRGCSSMVEPQSSKLMVRVRFPSSPPLTGRTMWSDRFFGFAHTPLAWLAWGIRSVAVCHRAEVEFGCVRICAPGLAHWLTLAEQDCMTQHRMTVAAPFTPRRRPTSESPFT